jgi:hypothetical protein
VAEVTFYLSLNPETHGTTYYLSTYAPQHPPKDSLPTWWYWAPTEDDMSIPVEASRAHGLLRKAGVTLSHGESVCLSTGEKAYLTPALDKIKARAQTLSDVQQGLLTSLWKDSVPGKEIYEGWWARSQEDSKGTIRALVRKGYLELQGEDYDTFRFTPEGLVAAKTLCEGDR